MIRVLLADDQRIVREGLETLLGLLEDVEVVGTAADGEEAVELAATTRPDVVLMDLRMPRCDGVEATRRLRQRHPDIKVLMLTTYADDRSVIDALRAGARGYLTKDAGAKEIEQALRQVMHGQAAIDPAVQHHLLDAIADAGDQSVPKDDRLPDGLTAARGRGPLTDRQGPVQRRDRGTARRQRDDSEEPHQPPVRQDRRPRPRPGRRLRLPARAGLEAGVLDWRFRQAGAREATDSGGQRCRTQSACPSGQREHAEPSFCVLSNSRGSHG